ncbi:MAG: Zn-dependent peptidase ImmA (M78 family) [Spirosomataceae bacterium]|jgi:Zn-dependent peptidase ImmA (M78 family)
MNSPFPQRLTTARIMRGWSLQKLADTLGKPYNKQLINRLESGSQSPDSEQLVSLSKALNKPTDFFLKPLSVSLGKVDFRKTLKVGKKATDRIIKVADEYLERYLELEDLLGIESGVSFQLQKVKLSLDQPEAIENEARKIRQKLWKVGLDPLGSIIHVLEEHGVKVFVLNELDGEYIDSKFSGFSTIANGNVGFIVLNGNPEIPLVRKRFTLLHEFAHLYLNLEELEERPAEKICDALAGTILIPKSAFIKAFGERRTSVNLNELVLFKRYFGASLPAIMYGLKNAGIVAEYNLTNFMIYYNKNKLRAKEKNGFNGREQSERFGQLLIRALEVGVISESKAAALNNMKTAEFRQKLESLIHEDSDN